MTSDTTGCTIATIGFTWGCTCTGGIADGLTSAVEDSEDAEGITAADIASVTGPAEKVLGANVVTFGETDPVGSLNRPPAVTGPLLSEVVVSEDMSCLGFDGSDGSGATTFSLAVLSAEDAASTPEPSVPVVVPETVEAESAVPSSGAPVSAPEPAVPVVVPPLTVVFAPPLARTTPSAGSPDGAVPPDDEDPPDPVAPAGVGPVSPEPVLPDPVLGPFGDPDVPAVSEGVEALSSVVAFASPGEVATAAPIPNATANAPTRPMYRAYPLARLWPPADDARSVVHARSRGAR